GGVAVAVGADVAVGVGEGAVVTVGVARMVGVGEGVDVAVGPGAGAVQLRLPSCCTTQVSVNVVPGGSCWASAVSAQRTPSKNAAMTARAMRSRVSTDLLLRQLDLGGGRLVLHAVE